MQEDNNNNAFGVAADYLFVCPSFSTYYCDRQAAASRAVGELSRGAKQPESELDGDEFGFAALRFEQRGCEDGGDVDDEDEFEFSALCDESSPESEIGRIFPIFDRDLMLGGAEKVEMPASVSLGKMFIEEREDRVRSGSGNGNGKGNVSSSSSEADEVDGVEWTCCVWKRKTPELSPGRSRKSKSTGPCSRRWKLLDLLMRRSSCDGKESFVFLTPSPSTSSNSSSSSESKTVKSKAARRTYKEYKAAGAVAAGGASAHEIFYMKNRAVREEERRRSYLPYRKGLVGFGFFLTVWA
uniref:Uncharacterized protein n=1 Tax=Kalanchoe fedtschenkoi TaxID=63787 RepID=A0A7N0VFV5_KALFE